MAGQFDPYHHWLCIPPAEQPPNHYRLLGLAPFESDPEIISYAADQRMKHVRTLQVGRHEADAQRILNGLSAARVCLLDEKKRAKYDKTLRRAGVLELPEDHEEPLSLEQLRALHLQLTASQARDGNPIPEMPVRQPPEAPGSDQGSSQGSTIGCTESTTNAFGVREGMPADSTTVFPTTRSHERTVCDDNEDRRSPSCPVTTHTSAERSPWRAPVYLLAFLMGASLITAALLSWNPGPGKKKEEQSGQATTKDNEAPRIQDAAANSKESTSEWDRADDGIQTAIREGLQPAKVEKVVLCPMTRRAIVLVREEQLALAVGRRDENVRLAGDRCVWNIDIMTNARLLERIEHAVSELSAVEGVREALARNLIAQGVLSYHDLAVIEPRALMKLGQLSAEQSEAILRKARAKVSEPKADLTSLPTPETSAPVSPAASPQQSDPAEIEAKLSRGIRLCKNGEVEKGIGELTAAMRMDPNNARLYHNRGVAWIMKGNATGAYDGAREEYDKAIADFDEAIRLNPSYAIAYDHRGLAYQKKGMSAQAGGDFAKAREIRSR